MIIRYATEIYTTSTLSNGTYGLQSGVFRFVTGNPQYDGHTVVPSYANNEIDLVGNFISPLTNSNIYYENWLTDDWCVGNPIRQCDFSLLPNYDMGASYSFKIRGDNAAGKYFWDFCNGTTPAIILQNAIVRFWIIIDNVFYSQWRGVVSKVIQDENSLTFECVDEANIIHKIMPPDTINIVETTTTVQTTVQDNVTNANTNVVSNIVPAPNQQVSQAVIPVAFGNIPYSPLVKFTDQNTFVPFYTKTSGYDSFISATVNLPDSVLCAAVNYGYNPTTPLYTPNIPDWNGVNHVAGLTLLCPPPENTYGLNVTSTPSIFVNNDPRLVGMYLTVISGENIDAEQAYRITANNASVLVAYTAQDGTAYTFYTVEIFFEEALLLSGNITITQSNFYLNNAYTFSISASSSSFQLVAGPQGISVAPLSGFVQGQILIIYHNATHYTIAGLFAYNDTSGAMTVTPLSIVGSGTFTSWQVSNILGASVNTWWFKISNLTIPTALSTINYDGGPSNLGQQFQAVAQNKTNPQGNDSGIIGLLEYDSSAQSYIDVADCADTESTGSDVVVKANTATPDGKVQHIEDIGFTIDWFGVRTAGPLGIINAMDVPPYYSSNIVAAYWGSLNANAITNKKQWGGIQIDLSSLSRNNEYYYVTVRFRVQPMNVSYDRIMFLCDLTLSQALNSTWFMFGSLAYSLFDNNGRIIKLSDGTFVKINDQYFPGNPITPPQLVAGTPYNLNLIPKGYYSQALNGYPASRYLQPAPYDLAGTYPWNNFYDFDLPKPGHLGSGGTMSKSDLTTSYVQFIECYLPLRAVTNDHGDPIPLPNDQAWRDLIIKLKQVTLLGVRMIDTVKGDLYVKTQGEATDKTNQFSTNPTQCSPAVLGTLTNLISILGLTTGQYFCTIDGTDTSDGALTPAKGSALEVGDTFKVLTASTVSYQVFNPEFNNYGQLATNSVASTFMHILEDYDQIPHKMIDYGDSGNSYYGLFGNRSLGDYWMIGRTIQDQKNSSDYLNELCTQSFTAMFQNRMGQRGIRGFEPGILSLSSGTGKTATHDVNLITDKSITDFSKTEWNQTYNSFNLKYNYDPGLKAFTKFFSICHVDDTRGFPAMSTQSKVGVSAVPSTYATLAALVSGLGLSVGSIFYTSNASDTTATSLLALKQAIFPAASLAIGDSFLVQQLSGPLTVVYYGPDIYNRDWTTYVSGAGISYQIAQLDLWGACHQQWNKNRTVKLAAGDISDLNWFIDSTSYNPADGSGSALLSSAYSLLLKLIGTVNGEHIIPGWATCQKDIVTYSIPINSNTVCHEIMDCLQFNEIIFSNSVNRIEWLMSIETDAKNDQFILRAVMLPVVN